MEFETALRRRYRIHLETPRFLLRPLVIGDVDWLTPLLADPEVNRFSWDSETDSAHALRHAEAIIALDLMRGQFGHWAIQDKTTGEIYGWTELGKLRPWSGPSDEISLSYVLCRKSWGQGIATEAAGRLLQHSLESLDTVMAVIDADNAASRRVLEKLRFRPVLVTESGHKTLQYFQIDAPPATPPEPDEQTAPQSNPHPPLRPLA